MTTHRTTGKTASPAAAQPRSTPETETVGETAAGLVLESDWQPRARAYAEALAAAGLLDPSWRESFAEVARHLFVPRFWALDGYNRPDRELRGTDPAARAEWLDTIYSNRTLITQWTSAPWRDRTIRLVTSSASEPGVVATMLDRLQPRPGDQVLEIGTGSGYNAALLCARLGDDRVTSIDIDPRLVKEAGAHLAAAGFHPDLHTGDAASTLPTPPAGGHYDRIIATCAVERIPPAWITHLAPGGRLVAPLTWGGALAVLDKTSPTEVTGRIDPAEIRFMHLRHTLDDPLPVHTAPGMPEPHPDLTHCGHTDTDPAVLDDADFRLWLALHRPDLLITQRWHDGAPTASIVYNQHEHAAAERDPVTPGLWPVCQHGGRPWDSVESAWRAYQRTGHPARHRLGITNRADTGGYIWLDEPNSAHTWPNPESSTAPAAGG